MSIYVHIPFCRSKCFYCGFYAVASLKLKEGFVRALCKEMDLRRRYLKEQEIKTLYWGGGTPSCLKEEEIRTIAGKLEENYCFAANAERSIEMNPEDMTGEKLDVLREVKFNRITVGVQSFHDDILKNVNRFHTARQVIDGIEKAVQAGFENIGIDLMLGLPGQTMKSVEEDLQQAVHLPITHVSVYMLSVDPSSVLEWRYRNGKFQPEPDEILAGKYSYACDYLKSHGFEHYEISNFAKNGCYSRHNLAYWQQKEYIGFGPAAHSYNSVSRQWNVASLKTYIESLDKDELSFQREELSHEDKYNEYIMTRFRTLWGVEYSFLENTYAEYWPHFRKKIVVYLRSGLAEEKEGTIRLTEKGWLVSDEIFCDLFV